MGDTNYALVRVHLARRRHFVTFVRYKTESITDDEIDQRLMNAYQKYGYTGFDLLRRKIGALTRENLSNV